MKQTILAALVAAATAPAEAQTPAPAASPKETPKWDVGSAPGPNTTASLDVTEGTWMTVDVSPDGSPIYLNSFRLAAGLPLRSRDCS